MNKIKVLLVEDETSLAMILSDTLEAQGFEMRTAHDGEEGLRMFDDQKPDVLVADVMMPKMDGFEMVRFVCAIPACAMRQSTVSAAQPTGASAPSSAA